MNGSYNKWSVIQIVIVALLKEPFPVAGDKRGLGTFHVMMEQRLIYVTQARAHDPNFSNPVPVARFLKPVSVNIPRETCKIAVIEDGAGRDLAVFEKPIPELCPGTVMVLIPKWVPEKVSPILQSSGEHGFDPVGDHVIVVVEMGDKVSFAQ